MAVCSVTALLMTSDLLRSRAVCKCLCLLKKEYLILL